MAPKNAFYAQSGGVSAVINASAGGVLQTARQNSEKIGKVYAGRNGIIGALAEDLIDTSVDKREARLQVPLGGARLPPAFGAPHRFGN
jgi:6-phosphofructokinase 1